MAIFIPPKGTSDALSSIALLEGELVFNTTEKKFYTGDGETLGGFPAFNGGGSPAPEGDFVTKDELSGYATKTDIAAMLTSEADPLFAEAVSGLATKQDVAGLISKDYVDEAVGEVNDAIVELKDGLEVNGVVKSDLEDYVSKDEIATIITGEEGADFEEAVESLAKLDDLTNYATTGYVKNEVKNEIDKSDYTSFEVTVISSANGIPAGTASTIDNPYVENEKLVYKFGVPATYTAMTEKFFLCSDTPMDKSDVVIDWGDGTQTAIADGGADVVLKKGKPSSTYNKIEVTHVYTVEDKYIVKIYGKDYFGIRNTDNDYNLISRVFEEDLSLASCVTDLTDFCNRARLLLKVDAARWINTKNVTVAYELFAGCHNLYYATGFYGFFPKLLRYNMMFSHCWSLVYTDMRIMPGAYAIYSMFAGCHLLGSLPNKPVKVEDLFCENASFNARVSANAAFRNCYSLKMSSPDKVANLLWDNVNTVFETGTGAAATFHFDDSIPSELIDYAPSLTAAFELPAWLSAVPTTWGGTNTENNTIVVNKALFNSILSRLDALEATVNGSERNEEAQP